jgi:hypothetical protein
MEIRLAKRWTRWLLAPMVVLAATLGTADAAQIVKAEPQALRLGQRALVDDGSCPTGQLKEIIGGSDVVTAPGQLPSRGKRQSRCVPRK